MTKFEDQLFADLMTQYRPVLDHLDRRTSARRVAPRVAWLTGAATAGTAGAVTAAVMLAGGSTPAYAVTQNPNGTVTLSVASPAGLKPANQRLKVLGDPVVVVPVGAGCPSIASLPHPQLPPGTEITGRTSDINGSLTIDIEGVPAGDTALVAMSTSPDGPTNMASAVISGPVPSCVSLPALPPAGSGSSSGASAGPGPGPNG
jgi:hypothetical protein